MDLDFLLGLGFKLLGSAPSQTNSGLFKDKDTQQMAAWPQASEPHIPPSAGPGELTRLWLLSPWTAWVGREAGEPGLGELGAPFP